MHIKDYRTQNNQQQAEKLPREEGETAIGLRLKCQRR